MVREVEMSGVIENVDFQKAFGILYGDEKFQKRYHKEISKDPSAVVTPWSREGRREVKFAAPVSAPKVVQMLLGADKLQVTEIQQYSKQENLIIVKSEPIFDAPGGSSFRTFGRVTLAPGDPDGNCRVSMTISLECTAGMWGVQGTVESYMEGHARRSFEGWMRIARIFCQEEAGQNQRPNFEDEEYFDFEDSRDDASVSGSESPSSGSSGSLVVGSSSEGRLRLDMWFVQSVLKELNGLQISGDASRMHLEKLNVKLQQIEDELLGVKAQLERQNRQWLQATSWGVVALSLAIGLIYGVRRLWWRSNRR